MKTGFHLYSRFPEAKGSICRKKTALNRIMRVYTLKTLPLYSGSVIFARKNDFVRGLRDRAGGVYWKKKNSA